MQEPTIYHNPQCSKSRAALELLRKHGLRPLVVHYLDHPPSAQLIAELIDVLGIRPQELIRFKDPCAKELGLEATDRRSPQEWIGLLSENPVLIERPVVQLGNRAVIGRPLENVSRLIAATRRANHPDT